MEASSAPEVPLQQHVGNTTPAGPSRREALSAFAAAGCACWAGLSGGCATVNPIPEYPLVPGGDGATLDLAGVPELAAPGGSIKVRPAPGGPPLIVWRTAADRFGAAAITCTHRGCEVVYNPQDARLDCPCHGSRFGPDGRVLRGPARTPLAAHPVRFDPAANRITIKP